MSEDLTMLTDAVHDVNGTEIAPAGAAVGKSLLGSVAGMGGSDRTVSLAEAGIPDDLAGVYLDEDLEPLFEDGIGDRIAGVLEKVQVPPEVLEELVHLRTDYPILYNHAVTTTAVTLRVAMEIVAKMDDLTRIARAVLLKDIGMTRIPAVLMQNRGYLTKQQYHQIRKHPVVGLLINTYYLGEGIEGMVALRHHMRNGAGYPRWGGLKPSKLVDIIEVVDVFYALISPRPFRPEPFDVRGAVDEITGMVQKGELSEEALKLLVACVRHDKPELRHVDLSDERLGYAPDANYYGTGPAE